MYRTKKIKNRNRHAEIYLDKLLAIAEKMSLHWSKALSAPNLITYTGAIFFDTETKDFIIRKNIR